MTTAIYREVEVVLVNEPSGWVSVDVRLSSGPITFTCPSEAIAISKAKDVIDKHNREASDSAAD